MLHRTYKKLKSENANSLVENVIVLPLIFIIIYFFILMAFIIHDRATLDAAAKRGTVYAARCISDPSYTSILQKSGHEKGSLDTNVEELTDSSFYGVGNNIDPYRYLAMDASTIRSATVAEVYGIIEKTKIPWRDIQTGDINVDIENKIIYQNVNVSITAKYPLPALFGSFGLPTEFEYTVEAQTAVNDPDEFIRNVDLIIDTCIAIDQQTGGNISKITSKIGDMAAKLKEYLAVND